LELNLIYPAQIAGDSKVYLRPIGDSIRGVFFLKKEKEKKYKKVIKNN
jgi:hypothetical protein